MKKLVPAMVLGLLLLPVALSAQQQRQGGGRGGAFAPQNVAQILVDHKADLQLNDDQSKQLEALAKTITTKTEPLTAELQKLMPQGGGRGQMDDATRAKLTEIRAAMTKVNDEAKAELPKFLSEAQVTKANEIIAAAQPQRGRRGGRGGGR